jgi:sphingosine kinase
MPSGVRKWCFISIALGLMVDLDIGTEHMRWMGDTRFLLGFLKGVAANKNFQCRLRMKVVESDKVSMARKARERSQEQVEAQRNGKVTNGMPRSNGQLGANGLVEAVNGLKVEEEEEQEGEDKRGEDKNGEERKREEREGLEAGPSSAPEVVPTMNGNGSNHDNDHNGPMAEAKPLEPDETWLTIESASKKPQIMSKGNGPVNGVADKTGGWIDGEGILYM